MRFRTRSQEVEAVQWTGMNDGALHALKPGVRIPSGSFRIQPGYWLVVSEDVVSEYDGYDWLHTDEFTMRYEPVPDLIRTVADYEGLPDGTILEVVDQVPSVGIFPKDDVLTKRRGMFFFAGAYGEFTTEYMVKRFVCSVVRLGGSQ